MYSLLFIDEEFFNTYINKNINSCEAIGVQKEVNGMYL